VVLGVNKVQETTKENFIANAAQIEMQRCHMYIVHHVITAANAVVVY
jgi:hypothetical protein